MRVAVHTIVKDEAEHLSRWAVSADDADLLQVTDTGSSDRTVQLARELGVRVTKIEVDPWRFDTARNQAMAMLPLDIDLVITLDADEVLVDGWRDSLEKAYAEHPKANRFRYWYVWSFTEDGKPDVRFHGERCVTRTGWQWKGACHEVLRPVLGPGEEPPEEAWGGFTIEHHPDPFKSRASYLTLLELAVREEPEDPRQAFYYGRELYYVGFWTAARGELLRFLGLRRATWAPERAAAWRLLAKMDDHPERWLLRACAETPDRRESWVALAEHYQGRGLRTEAAGAAARALRVTERQGDYLTTAASWDDTKLRAIAREGRWRARYGASGGGTGPGVFE